MTTQQTALADARGRLAFAGGIDYNALPDSERAEWKSAATEAANRARRERLAANPESRDTWDKDPI